MADTPRQSTAPTFRMLDVRKRFGGTIALDGVSFELAPGEVHALVGENGAGKSTLMRVLSGAIRADHGVMHFKGDPWAPNGPIAARRAGVAMIHQELALASHLSVAENIALGREPGCGPRLGRLRLLRRREMHEAARTALGRLGHEDIDPAVRVQELTPAQRQVVEIARALAGQAEVVVMDEPTTSLSTEDARRLLEVVARLRDDGTSIVYISHFLEEVQQVADRWTVLRDGKTVATGTMAGTPLSALIEHMTGRPVDKVFPARDRTPGEVLLDVRGVSGARLPSSASFQVARGEILGLAGLVGAGRPELLRVLAGLDPMLAGSMTIDGEELRGGGARGRLARGLGLLSEDRKGEGLALQMSISTNLLLSRLGPASRGGVLSLRRMRDLGKHWMRELVVRADDPDREAATLSGGNQQKIAIGRLLHQDAEVLLLDEPTRGIDVGSKVQVYALLDRLARAGRAIVVSSGYLPELLGLCDSIAVMHRGVLGPKHRAENCTEDSIMTEAVLGPGKVGAA